MPKIEDRPGEEEESQDTELALVRKKIKELAAAGKIHYIGELDPDDRPFGGQIESEEVDIYVGLVGTPTATEFGSGVDLARSAEALAAEMGYPNKYGYTDTNGHSEWGAVRVSEQTGTKTTNTTVALTASDVSTAMRTSLEKIPSQIVTPITRETVLRVYADRASAFAHYQVNSGAVSIQVYVAASMQQDRSIGRRPRRSLLRGFGRRQK